jgi:hypothetical protein
LFLRTTHGKKSLAGDLPSGRFFESGGVKSYRPEQAESITRVTSMVDTIDLPVE